MLAKHDNASRRVPRSRMLDRAFCGSLGPACPVTIAVRALIASSYKLISRQVSSSDFVIDAQVRSARRIPPHGAMAVSGILDRTITGSRPTTYLLIAHCR